MPTFTDRRSRTVTLPFVLLASPIAWLLSLTVSYVGHDFACAGAETATFTVSTDALSVVLLILNIILLIVAAASGVLGFRIYRSARDTGESAATAQFIGVTGLAMAVLFVFGIILIAVNYLVFAAC
jgi:hypothetical protein